MAYLCDDCHKTQRKCFCTIANWCVCGECITNKPEHKCDPKRLKKIDDSRESHSEKGIIRTPDYNERLSDGFAMMDEDE